MPSRRQSMKSIPSAVNSEAEEEQDDNQLPQINLEQNLPRLPVQEINIEEEAAEISAESEYNIALDNTCHMLDTPQILVAEDQPICMKVIEQQMAELKLTDYCDYFYSGQLLLERVIEILKFECEYNQKNDKKDKIQPLKLLCLDF